jgi:hypothetical protein
MPEQFYYSTYVLISDVFNENPGLFKISHVGEWIDGNRMDLLADRIVLGDVVWTK